MAPAKLHGPALFSILMWTSVTASASQVADVPMRLEWTIWCCDELLNKILCNGVLVRSMFSGRCRKRAAQRVAPPRSYSRDAVVSS
jgi:hypothetical protein